MGSPSDLLQLFKETSQTTNSLWQVKVLMCIAFTVSPANSKRASFVPFWWNIYSSRRCKFLSDFVFSANLYANYVKHFSSNITYVSPSWTKTNNNSKIILFIPKGNYTNYIFLYKYLLNRVWFYLFYFLSLIISQLNLCFSIEAWKKKEKGNCDW